MAIIWLYIGRQAAQWLSVLALQRHGWRNGANFKYRDVKTVIKFHVLLGKIPHIWHNMLKVGLETHNLLLETVDGRWIPVTPGRKKHATVVACVIHVHAVLEHIHRILHTTVAAEVGISPPDVFHILNEHTWKWKICVKWIPHVLNNCQYMLLSTSSFHYWQWERDTFFYHTLLIRNSWMDSFDLELKQQNAKW